MGGYDQYGISKLRASWRSTYWYATAIKAKDMADSASSSNTSTRPSLPLLPPRFDCHEPCDAGHQRGTKESRRSSVNLSLRSTKYSNNCSDLKNIKSAFSLAEVAFFAKVANWLDSSLFKERRINRSVRPVLSVQSNMDPSLLILAAVFTCAVS